MKITVSRQELEAVLQFASTDDSRYILNGVKFESRKDDAPLLIATDGRSLAVLEGQKAWQEHEVEEGSFVLETSFLKPIIAMSKAFGKKLFPLINIELPTIDRIIVTLIGSNVFIESHDKGIIKGNYPAWRPIIPSKDIEREAVHNLALHSLYISNFTKAAKILQPEQGGLRFNLVGPDKVIEVNMVGAPNFYGMLMPMKDDAAEFQPEFLGISKEAA